MTSALLRVDVVRECSSNMWSWPYWVDSDQSRRYHSRRYAQPRKMLAPQRSQYNQLLHQLIGIVHGRSSSMWSWRSLVDDDQLCRCHSQCREQPQQKLAPQRSQNNQLFHQLIEIVHGRSSSMWSYPSPVDGDQLYRHHNGCLVRRWLTLFQ